MVAGGPAVINAIYFSWKLEFMDIFKQLHFLYCRLWFGMLRVLAGHFCANLIGL